MIYVKCSAPTAVHLLSAIAETTLVHGVKRNLNMRGSVIREDGSNHAGRTKACGCCG